MGSTHHISQMREAFVAESRFIETGGVVTDLAGTAVHEDRIIVPEPVVEGLKAFPEPLAAFSFKTAAP